MPHVKHDAKHGTATSSGRHYWFTVKHHCGSKRAAQWDASLTFDEEFSVFDSADKHQISDARKWLYGLLPTTDGSCRLLGTRGEQLAEFPFSRRSDNWHGYPLYPLLRTVKNRGKGVGIRKPRWDVFKKIIESKLISEERVLRLWKGDHI